MDTKGKINMEVKSEKELKKEVVNESSNKKECKETAKVKTTKKGEPDISIIIPVYNVEKYLRRCLDSILSNSYENLEVICIDNGSTDGSCHILKYYEKKDDRVIVLKQSKSGPSAARNMGLDKARGKYISFVDSDDFVQYNAYEILIEVAEENELDMVIFGANTIPWQSAPEWMNRIINTRYMYYKDCEGSSVVFKEPACRPFLWMHFIKRELFEKPTKLRFDESMMLGEDQLLQFQYIPRAKNIMVIDDKLYNYQISRSGSLMQMYSSRKVKKVETHLKLVRKILDTWEYDGEFWKEEGELLTWIVNFLYYSIVEFPIVYKRKYAKQILELLEENKFSMCLLADWEHQHYKELQEWSENVDDEEKYIQEEAEKTADEKHQIREILKSKCFKWGRKLTRKKDRMDLSEYSSYLE